MSRFDKDRALTTAELLSIFSYRSKGLTEPQHMRDLITSCETGIDTTATAAEINSVADVSARVATLTASGAIAAGIQSVELDHTSVAIAATIADASLNQGLFIIKATTEPGVAADHTVVITTGTFDGTNKTATFADVNDTLIVYFDSAGNGTVVENVGTVVLSA